MSNRTIIEGELEIAKEQKDKRQKLMAEIDWALCCYGGRVTAGAYRITIEKLGPKAPAPTG